jgi:hypothetical protein
VVFWDAVLCCSGWESTFWMNLSTKLHGVISQRTVVSRCTLQYGAYLTNYKEVISSVIKFPKHFYLQ